MNHSPLLEDRELCALDKYSFSDEAASLVLKEHTQLQMRYASNIGEVWKSISERGGLGMIPLENSSGGVVWPHLEKLMKEQELQIAAAVRLQVRMCAGGLPGANIDDVTSIHSHPKALEQCSTFIGQLPQSIQKIETSSTVAGVEQVADLKDIRHIALASKSAIEALGLTVLKEDVADLSGEENVTKFLVVHKNGGQKLPIIDYEHHAALITPRGGQRGILAGALTQIATCGIDLDSIHSRSIGPSDYAFYLGMQREGTPEEMGVLAQWLEVSQTVKSVKWLGSWNEEFKN